jgi:hypothetical protein
MKGSRFSVMRSITLLLAFALLMQSIVTWSVFKCLQESHDWETKWREESFKLLQVLKSYNDPNP